MSSKEPDLPGLSVFGLPLPFAKFLELLPLAGELGLLPLDVLEDFGPRHPTRSADKLMGWADKRMGWEAPPEFWQQRLERRHQMFVARQRVASVTGEALRKTPFELFPLGGESGLGNLIPQSWFGSSRPSERIRGEAELGKYVNNLILHAESEGIGVTWGSFPYFLGGFVHRRQDGPHVVQRDPEKAPTPVDAGELARVAKADVLLMLNYSQGWAHTFDVLLHELAHVLLGHVGAMRGVREGRLAIDPFRFPTVDVMEFEAFSVNHIVSAAMGTVDPKLKLRLIKYFLSLRARGEADLVHVLDLFIVSEILCAWCVSPPDRNGMAARTRGGPRLPLSGQRST